MADFIISAGVIVAKVAAVALICVSCVAIYLVETKRYEA